MAELVRQSKCRAFELTPSFCAKKGAQLVSWEEVYVTNIKIVSQLDCCCSFVNVAHQNPATSAVRRS